MATHRAILHLDLDAFFVACELLRRPELRGLPVAVGGGAESHPGERRQPGRGVVAAASYEARPHGVRSAQPLAQALRLCSELVVLPVDIGHYASMSERVFTILGEYTPLLEPGSLDEAYLDVTGSHHLHGEAAAIAAELQRRLLDELGLPASVGVAGNKTVAKVASDLRKPQGLVVVADGEEAVFLAPLPVARLPGLGPKTQAKLHLLGISTLGQLVAAGDSLAEALGPGAQALQLRAAGVDPSPVTLPGMPKSVSREETYFQDLTSQERLEARLRALSAGVGKRLRASALSAGAVSVKIRFANFETVIRRHRLPQASNADLDLELAARELFRANWPPGRAVRLLGVGAENLADEHQLELFAGHSERSQQLDLALDRLRQRFGGSVIARGTESLDDPIDWNRDHLRRLPPR
ncbi:MAG: DNA polymerase IV [Candidatus Dormibacteria bacterium]